MHFLGWELSADLLNLGILVTFEKKSSDHDAGSWNMVFFVGGGMGAEYFQSFWWFVIQWALVALLDACLTGDQEDVGLTSASSATFFSGNWSWNIFYSHSLPSTDSRKAVVGFWRKNVHTTG